MNIQELIYVSITKEKLQTNLKKNDDEMKNIKSYAILRLGLNSTIDSLKKIFDFKKNQILGASQINDKNGKPTTQVKLVFDKANISGTKWHRLCPYPRTLPQTRYLLQ